MSKLFGKLLKIPLYKSYNCSFCDENATQKFKSKNKLEQHTIEFHSFECSFCNNGGIFKNNNDLEAHYKLVHPFKCDFCEVGGLENETALNEHIKNHHNLTCVLCDDNQVFDTKSDLEEHKRTKHYLKCNFCSANGIKTQKDLKEHIRLCHCYEARDQAFEAKQIWVFKCFKCIYCDTEQTFENKEDLDGHMKIFHFFQCEFCEIDSIKTQSDLEEHLKIYHSLKCTFCDKNPIFENCDIFRTQETLDKHIKILHKCDICESDEIFERTNDKLEHIKLYHCLKCPHCDVDRIKTKIALDEHIKLLHHFESCFHVDKKTENNTIGQILRGTNLNTNEKVAIKLESKKVMNCTERRLSTEYEHYQLLGGHKGIPEIYMFDEYQKQNALVMELLGPSLKDLFKKCGRSFSLNTVLCIAIQVIDLLDYIHSKHLVHCYLSPRHILIGSISRNKEKKLHLIDFGFSTKYIDPNTGKHVPDKENFGSVSGTIAFMSINAHLGKQQSRKDDLESLGYMLIYFMQGNLPWQNLKPAMSSELKTKICDIKSTISIEKLCEDCPKEFQKIIVPYFQHVRNLKFDESPDYAYIRKLFSCHFDQGYLDYENVKFDWANFR